MAPNKLNSQLGNLGHLPQELRDKIYRMVFTNHLEDTIQTTIDDMHAPSLFEADILLERDFLREKKVHFQPCLARCGKYQDPDKPVKEDFLDLRWYLPLYAYQKWFELRLRHASFTLRNQFDIYFFSNYDIKFACPTALSEFFSRLPAEKRMSLRRITIQICIQCGWCEACKDWTSIDDDTKRWIQAIEGLPATALESLTVVNFEVGTQGLPGSFSGLAGYCEGHYTPVLEFRNLVKSLSVLAGELRRRAPNVRVRLSGEECYGTKDSDVFRAAIMA